MDLRVFVGIDEVVGTDKTAVGDHLCGLPLLFTEQGTADGVDIAVVVGPRGDLHEVEGDLTESELTPPLLHQDLQPFGILVTGVAHV